MRFLSSPFAERNTEHPSTMKILRQTGSSSQRRRNSKESYKPETGQFCEVNYIRVSKGRVGEMKSANLCTWVKRGNEKQHRRIEFLDWDNEMDSPSARLTAYQAKKERME